MTTTLGRAEEEGENRDGEVGVLGRDGGVVVAECCGGCLEAVAFENGLFMTHVLLNGCVWSNGDSLRKKEEFESSEIMTSETPFPLDFCRCLSTEALSILSPVCNQKEKTVD